jgi:hypothetical protein
MTELRKPVRRRLTLPRGPVSVTLYPDGTIGFREPRRRCEYRLPLARVFVLAADAYQQDAKLERRRARRASFELRRGGR